MAATSRLQSFLAYCDIISVRAERTRPPFRRELLRLAYRAGGGSYLNFEGSAPAVRGEFEITDLPNPLDPARDYHKIKPVNVRICAVEGGVARRESQRNPPLFHKTNLQCAKHVKNKFFLRAKSMPTVTSTQWKRNSPKLR